ncbi:MAG: thioredoxin family protein [Rhodospirillales bacterium]|nr:thioredoxin family protein [Rhodospirillales bacterium]
MGGGTWGRRFIIGLLTAAVLAAAPHAVRAAAGPALGKTAPDFTGTDSYGKSHTLSAYHGKVVILEWFNDGCPFVGKHYGTRNMQTLQKEAAAQGVVWLSVVSSAPGRQGYSTPERANRLVRDWQAAPTAVLLDPKGTIGRLYDAKVTPHMYIINKQGALVYKGAIDDIPSPVHEDVKVANNYVRAALKEVMAGQPVSKPSSRAYGCTVKYAW